MNTKVIGNLDELDKYRIKGKLLTEHVLDVACGVCRNAGRSEFAQDVAQHLALWVLEKQRKLLDAEDGTPHSGATSILNAEAKQYLSGLTEKPANLNGFTPVEVPQLITGDNPRAYALQALERVSGKYRDLMKRVYVHGENLTAVALELWPLDSNASTERKRQHVRKKHQLSRDALAKEINRISVDTESLDQMREDGDEIGYIDPAYQAVEDRFDRKLKETRTMMISKKRDYAEGFAGMSEKEIICELRLDGKPRSNEEVRAARNRLIDEYDLDYPLYILYNSGKLPDVFWDVAEALENLTAEERNLLRVRYDRTVDPKEKKFVHDLSIKAAKKLRGLLKISEGKGALKPNTANPEHQIR